MNTLFALERYRAHPTSTVIASGGVQPPSNDGYPEGAVIRDALVRNHVPADRIVVEGQSTTTREQAVATARILRQLGRRPASSSRLRSRWTERSICSHMKGSRGCRCT